MLRRGIALVVGVLVLLTGLMAVVALAADEEAGPPRRGCLACHTLVDKGTGQFTLGYEAQVRTQADFGRDHPKKALDGSDIGPADEANVKACLTCHAAGSGDRAGKGKFSNLSLRDIVHPAHMSSPVFIGELRGSCFNCHNVNGEGKFEILSEAVEVNEKGIPKSLLEGKGTISGAFLPAE